MILFADVRRAPSGFGDFHLSAWYGLDRLDGNISSREQLEEYARMNGETLLAEAPEDMRGRIVNESSADGYMLNKHGFVTAWMISKAETEDE